MVSRLAALDLARVFDVNGTGLIERVVLIRALKVWDKSVFTDDNIDDFLRWAGLEKGGAHLNIQDIVRFVKARAPKLPRLRRRSGSRDSRASGTSEATSEAMTFSAAPRSCRTREPDEEGRGGSTRGENPPAAAQAGSVNDPAWDTAWQDAQQEVREGLSPHKKEPVPPIPEHNSEPALSTDVSSEPVEPLQPPSPRLVKRLAGLDILRVLDIEGNGLINKQVLKRSLKVFDPEVFTDEGVSRLIYAASRGKPAVEGGDVRILDLAQYMGSTVFFQLTPGTLTSASSEDAATLVMEQTEDRKSVV